MKKCFTLYTATYHRNVHTDLLKYKCFFKNDLPTESLSSAFNVNVFLFFIFLPWWSAVPPLVAFEQQEPATRGFLGVLALYCLPCYCSCYCNVFCFFKFFFPGGRR